MRAKNGDRAAPASSGGGVWIASLPREADGRPTQLITWAKRWVWLLPAWAALLAVSSVNHQPDYVTRFADYADYVTGRWFLISHLVASIGGAALAVVGALALAVLFGETPGGARAGRGAAIFAAGNVITSSVFGVAAFFQPAVGELYVAGDHSAAKTVNDAVYSGPLLAAVIIGLVLLVAGMAIISRAAVAAGTLSAWGGRALWLLTVVFVIAGLPGLVIQPVAAAALAAVATALVARARRI